jgi:hypothetical protein
MFVEETPCVLEFRLAGRTFTGEAELLTPIWCAKLATKFSFPMSRSVVNLIRGPLLSGSPLIFLRGGIPVVHDSPSLLTIKRKLGLLALSLQLLNLCQQ